MTAPGRYGKLGTPENRIHIEVRENPVQVVRAAYRIWLPAAWRYPLKIDRASILTGDHQQAAERLYQEAVRALATSTSALEDIRPGQLEAILTDAKHEETNFSGVFLSAVHNSTPIQHIEGEFRHEILGYRLAPGKTLTVRKGSDITCLGWHTQGTIINHGTAHDFADHAQDGLQYNDGTVGDMARWAQGGIQVNRALITRDMAWSAQGGIQVNAGQIFRGFAFHAEGGIQVNSEAANINCETPRDGQMAFNAQGGIQVNRGSIGRIMAEAARGGIRINNGRIRAWSNLLPNSRTGVHVNRKRPDQEAPVNSPTLNWPLIERLEQRLAELDIFAIADGEAALKTYQSRDWRRYERETLALGKQIERTSR
jgi:hypothetical protein